MLKLSSPLPDRASLESAYARALPALETTLEELQRRVVNLLADAGLRAGVKARVKGFRSLYEKAQRKLKSHDESEIALYDVLGIRVVSPFMRDVDQTEALLSEHFPVADSERKGAEYSYHEFGYVSTHLLLSTPAELTPDFGNIEPFRLAEPYCEVQLRTILQDAWAEVEHELIYKNEFTPFDAPLRRKLSALNANLSLADTIFQEIRDYQHLLKQQLRLRRERFTDQVGHGSQAAPATEPGSAAAPEGSAAPPPGSAAPPPGSAATVDRPASSRAPGASVDELLLEGLYAHNQGRLEDAIRTYSLLLGRELTAKVRAIVLVHRGMGYFATGNGEGAREDFTEAIRTDPEHARAYYYRGTVDLERDDESAEADFSRSLAIDRSQPDVLLARAGVRTRIGKPEQALADCRESLRIDPNNEQARRLLSELQANRNPR